MKKRVIKIFVTVVLILITVSLLVFGFTYLEKKGYMYKIREYLGINREKLKISVVTPETAELGFEDKRLEFNRSLMLINSEYTIPDDFLPVIELYKSTTVLMDSYMVSDYSEMSSFILSEFNEKLYVASHFRTAADQQAEYDKDPLVAAKVGASEHQSGLALDVYVAYYSGNSFIKSPVGQFVAEHGWEYGFIVRYPSYGTEITGIGYEPWHIRYVGKFHAKLIYNQKLTLEEYILNMEVGKWYMYDGVIFGRVKAEDNKLEVPKGYNCYSVSPDNTGYYIVTAQNN